jgi:hypothetical protein
VEEDGKRRIAEHLASRDETRTMQIKARRISAGVAVACVLAGCGAAHEPLTNRPSDSARVVAICDEGQRELEVVLHHGVLGNPGPSYAKLEIERTGRESLPLIASITAKLHNVPINSQDKSLVRRTLSNLEYNRKNLTALIAELRRRPGIKFSDMPSDTLRRFFVVDATCTRRRPPING